MYRTVWGTLPKNLLGGQSHLLQKKQKTNVSFCHKTFTMAEDPKANSVQKHAKKRWRNWEANVKKWWGDPLQKGICPRRPERSPNLRNLLETLAEPRWNLGETFRGTFWQPKTDLPQRTIESPKAILPRNLYYGWRPQIYCSWGKTNQQKEWSASWCSKDVRHNLGIGLPTLHMLPPSCEEPLPVKIHRRFSCGEKVAWLEEMASRVCCFSFNFVKPLLQGSLIWFWLGVMPETTLVFK